MCAKYKFQMGEHLLDHQVQNHQQAANGIQISKHVHNNYAINCQCFDYEMNKNLISDSENLIN
jgi:hypothetical protein